MGARDYYKLGDHNAICYVCGFKRKASEMLRRWDGVYVCREDWEPRQPQDFVRGPTKETPPAWTQPEPPDVFLNSFAPLTNIVVGTPSIYVGGVLKTSGVDYTITLPQGLVKFNAAPAAGLVVAWSGTWLDNAGVRYTYAQYPLYIADGATTEYDIYGAQ